MHTYLLYAVVSHFEPRATVALVNLPRSARGWWYVYPRETFPQQDSAGTAPSTGRLPLNPLTRINHIYTYPHTICVHMHMHIYIYISMYMYSLNVGTFRVQLFHTSSRAYKSLWWIFLGARAEHGELVVGGGDELIGRTVNKRCE